MVVLATNPGLSLGKVSVLKMEQPLVLLREWFTWWLETDNEIPELIPDALVARSATTLEELEGKEAMQEEDFEAVDKLLNEWIIWWQDWSYTAKLPASLHIRTAMALRRVDDRTAS